MHIACDLAATIAERIDTVPLAKRQVISQPTAIRVDGARSQAKLNLEIQPICSD
jgi:hypothetical protein